MGTATMRPLAAVTVVAVLAAGCSTAPRDFTPTLAGSGAAPGAGSGAGPTKPDADLAECRTEAANAANAKSGKTTAVVGGSTVGVGVGALTAGSAASGAGMLSGAAAGAGLATGFVVATPIAIVVISKSIRSRKERRIRDAMTQCLQARGYTVGDWQRTPRDSTARPK